MLFSARDLDILKLLRWCRLIRADALCQLVSELEIANLPTLSMVKLYRSSGAYLLTAKGNRLLDEAIPGLPAATPPAYKAADTIRRLHLSEIMLTAYSSGVDPFALHTNSLLENLTFFLPAISRGRGTNPWGSTRVAAIAHLGDLLCSIHYVCPEIGRLALNDELAAFHNNTALLPDFQRAMIFSGTTYNVILSELEAGENEPDAKLLSYGEAYRLLRLPVFLVPCNSTGAIQLRILSVPDYRQKLTQAALKSQYEPPPTSFPLCDAFFHDAPFLLAADMELRRIDAAIDAARAQGFSQISLAALPAQCEEVLYHRYRDTGNARVFALTDTALKQVLGSPLPPYAPPHKPYFTKEGAVIHVPLIKAR